MTTTTTETPTVFDDVSFYSADIGKPVFQHHDDDDNPVYTRPTVTRKPRVGMRVRVFYWRHYANSQWKIEARPIDEPGDHRENGSPRVFIKIGNATITHIRYKPGRSGTLYPYVDVAIDGAE